MKTAIVREMLRTDQVSSEAGSSFHQRASRMQHCSVENHARK